MIGDYIGTEIFICDMDMSKTNEPTLEELEAEMDKAVKAYKELKEKIKACTDEESDEYFFLGIAEFNHFNYMDMLDEEIREKRKSLESAKQNQG